MFVSQTAEYALRAMTQIALLPDRVAVTVADLAAATAIPEAYLSKVMRKMVKAKLVTGRKGHGGGFRLARAPGDISLGNVLAAAGLEYDPTHCAFGWARCNSASPCALHFAWSELTDRCRSWGRDVTLLDVIERARTTVTLRQRPARTSSDR